MKTFYQWIKANKEDLSFLNELPLDEKQARGGLGYWAYPSAYVRHQYPDPYFTPIAADAPQKMGYAKGAKFAKDKA